MRWRAHRWRSAGASWSSRPLGARPRCARRRSALLAFDHQPGPRGVAAPLAEHHHRPAAEHVGQLRRLDVVHVEAFEARLHAASAPAPRSSGAARSACAAACSGLVTMKGSPWPARARPSIRCRLTRRADAEGEHVGLAEVPAHQLEDLALDRHVAVGHDDHAARHVGRLRQRGDAAQRRHDLGAAAAAHLLDGLRWRGRCWRGWPAPSAAPASGCCRRTASR